ncbi:nucleotide sugar dehydrogenase [uncultured Brevibacillus sp.]|uniref:nucleotide sugar dehydrogenase n=1 Tax=uncultured Brevibacillus sp. TaxID=169970 RepID=UPI002594D26F|nr:nucleotide sugar dehydrogenase [uncultured Brevibacillus sp.]
MKVLVVGCGYVGLTTGCVLGYLGHDVTMLDVDPKKVQMLQQGNIPIFERGLQEVLHQAADRIQFTADWDEVDVSVDAIMIAVGTPSLDSGEVDLSYVEQAVVQVAGRLEAEHRPLLVIKSTVPIGTGKRMRQLVEQERAKKGKAGRVILASIPEFLREGEALHDTLYPDRIVVGLESPDGHSLIQDLFCPLLEQSFLPPSSVSRPKMFSKPELVLTDIASAEMIKYASNAFLAMKISFINEFANLAEKTGADIVDVARGIGLDKRIGPRFLQAGIGWGGSCFGKDTQAVLQMGKQHQCEMALVDAAVQVNQRQREWVLQKLRARLRTIEGRTVGILGLAFKPNTDDLRDAPSLDIIRRLVDEGARVKVYDPVATPNCQRQFPNLGVTYSLSAEEVFTDADAIILVTEWEEFRHLPYERLALEMNNRLLIDSRNFLDRSRASSIGYEVVGIGRKREEPTARVLVTGGAGFIGSHLVDSLLAEGFEVMVIDNYDPYYSRTVKERNLRTHQSYSQYHFVEADIADRDAMEKVFRDFRPEKVIHLAAKAGVRPSVQNPLAYVQTNVVGTTHLLDLSVAWGVKKFIFGSSSSVYGVNEKVPFSEKDAINRPASPYAATKVTGEALCQSYQNCYGLPVIALRFFTVFGPRQRPDLAIQTFTRKMLNGEPIQLFGDGTTSRDYTFVEDIVAGIRKAMDYESDSFEVFNLGNDQPTSLMDLVGLLEKLLDKKAQIDWLPMQTGDVPITWADLERSKRLLGYRPQTSLEAGLEQYLTWYQEQE